MSSVSALIFFSAFIDLQSIRDNEATTSKELLFLSFDRCSDYFTEKNELKLQTLAKL